MPWLTGFCVLIILFMLGLAAFSHDTGYVLISWGKTSIEMSLVLAVFIAAVFVWMVARLVSLELWLRGHRVQPKIVQSHKKSSNASVAMATGSKNPASRAR